MDIQWSKFQRIGLKIVAWGLTLLETKEERWAEFAMAAWMSRSIMIVILYFLLRKLGLACSFCIYRKFQTSVTLGKRCKLSTILVKALISPFNILSEMFNQIAGKQRNFCAYHEIGELHQHRHEHKRSSICRSRQVFIFDASLEVSDKLFSAAYCPRYSRTIPCITNIETFLNNVRQQ